MLANGIVVVDSEDEDVIITGESAPPRSFQGKAAKIRKRHSKRKKKKAKKRRKMKAAARAAPAQAPSEARPVPRPDPRSGRLEGQNQAEEADVFGASAEMLHSRVRAAKEFPAAICTACFRPLAAAGPEAAVVEFRRPGLSESCRVHAQIRCLASAGLLHASPVGQVLPTGSRAKTDPMQGSSTQGVLRSLQRQEQSVHVARAPRLPNARSLAAARQMAVAAALRTVRRAARDAADEAVSGQHRRRQARDDRPRPAERSRTSPLFEALLAALPPAEEPTRHEIPKGERCAVCHGKLLRKGRKIRRLPCGHIFHDECILPWLQKRTICPLDRRDLSEMVQADRPKRDASWVATMVSREGQADDETEAMGSQELPGDLPKYLIASFPALKQVGYTILPDNVWRPLVLGEVQSPTAIAVDPLSSRMFVADPPRGVIWWYQLGTGSNGMLQTVGRQRAAVEGFSAHWLAVNGAGDLYFSGHPLPKAGENVSVDSVWRLDNEQVVTGDTFNPSEIYTTANTGQPDSKVYQLSGLAVDSFYIFWGNQAGGKQHGAVNKGTRSNIGLASQDMFVTTLADAVEEVRGITTSGTEVFWVSPDGVFGQSKTTTSKVSDPTVGLISAPSTAQWNPMSIAWDGATELYLTDVSAGAIYTVPSLISSSQSLSKFADAPDCHGLAILLSAKGS
ncbi:rnf126-a [Symbiodinium natans]|uniref:Rnf126-a protein n=1 Tax=Symbiodinium natans TaxID=878477 RepID=A0A812Q4T0_9DINO|nr:rnf126-a [Symbiodinium natans]